MNETRTHNGKTESTVRHRDLYGSCLSPVLLCPCKKCLCFVRYMKKSCKRDNSDSENIDPKKVHIDVPELDIKQKLKEIAPNPSQNQVTLIEN